MKRINQWSVGVLVLFFTACTQEPMTDIPEAKQPAPEKTLKAVNIAFEIDNTIKGEKQTRVGGDFMIPAEHQLRYIIEVYVDGQDTPITREVKTGNQYYNFSFENVRLPIDHKYMAVCWADFVKKDNANNLHYNADNLQNIIQQPSGCSNPDLLDAYTGQIKFVIDDNGDTQIYDENKTLIPGDLAVTLKRPLVRIKMENILLENAISGQYAIIYQANEVCTSYNAFTNQVKESTIDFNAPTRFQGEFYEISNPNNTPFNLTDYVFMDDNANKSRPLNIKIVHNGMIPTYYTKSNGLPIHIQLSSPNVSIKIKGSDDNLKLKPVSAINP